MNTYPHRRSWEDEAAAGLVAGTVALALLAIAVIGILIVGTLAEGLYVYKTRAFQPTRNARTLWIALAGLLIAWLIAAGMATLPDMRPAAGLLAAWAFLAWAIVTVTIEAAARTSDIAAPGLALQDVLQPWHFEEHKPEMVTEYSNGNRQYTPSAHNTP